MGAHGAGIDAYHAWLIKRTESGCSVVTEETQKGAMARLQNALLPRRMHDQHQIWLDSLRDQAEGNKP